MDNWILNGVRNLVNTPAASAEISPTQVKVKVTHLLLSNYDALLWGGEITAKYPKTLGRFAVGIVTEAGADCYGIKKNKRVYLHPARGCGKCLACISGKKENCTDIALAGRDFDGFLRDFVVCDYTEVTPLPDNLDDMLALCIEITGIAENIYDKLNLSAGQRVAVIGGDFMGNIIAQVLQYHKLIPIVIENNPGNLDKAKKCGISYAFPDDDDLESNVKDATSGELCDAAIYSASSRLPMNLPARLIGKEKSIVLSGYTAMHSNIDVCDVLEKNLKIFGVTNAYGYTDEVINMLLRGAVSTDVFDIEVKTEYDPAALIAERYENIASSNKAKMTVLKMIL